MNGNAKTLLYIALNGLTKGHYLISRSTSAVHQDERLFVVHSCPSQ